METIIRAYRRSQGASAKSISDAAGCSPQMLNDIEFDRRTPSPTLAHRLLSALNAPLDIRSACVCAWATNARDTANAWDSVSRGVDP